MQPPLPTTVQVQHSSMMMGPQPFPGQIYGPTPYHLLAQSNHEMGSSSHPPALSRGVGSYFPVVDLDLVINGPQPNISSERFDPSLSVTQGTSNLLKSDG